MSYAPLPNRYFARGGKVFVKVDGEAPREVCTAITSQGRELERFEQALQKASQQALETIR